MTTASTNAELEARYRAVLPSYLAPLYEQPISIDRGEGSFVWDVEGNRYMDWFGGVLTTMVGHSQPEVVAAPPAADDDPEEAIDPDELVDVPPSDVPTPVDSITRAFPGAQVVDRET